MATDPDLTDPDAGTVVLRDHAPQEYRNVYGELLGVACGACFKAWPCPSVIAAREAEDAHRIA